MTATHLKRADAMASTPRRLRLQAGFLVVIMTLGLIAVGVYDPNEPGVFPPCPFRALTDYLCPGCGTLRMIHALLHGDLGTAWSLHPLGVLLTPVGLWYFLNQTSIATRGRQIWAWQMPSWAGWTVLAVVLAYWLGRNII